MLLVILLFILGLTHMYWAFGGSVGLDVALPTNENGERLLNPGVFMIFVVAFLLFVFAYIAYYVRSGTYSLGYLCWLEFDGTFFTSCYR